MDMGQPEFNLRFIGVSDTKIEEGALNNPIRINGRIVHVKKRDCVFYITNTFVFDGMAWRCIT